MSFDDKYRQPVNVANHEFTLALQPSRIEGATEHGTHSVEITDDEACIFLNDEHRAPYINLKTDVCNIAVPGIEPSKNDPSIQTLRSQLPFPRHAVLLDATTLRSANDALDDPSPIGLLDLAALATAFVFYDNIVLQPGFHADFVKQHADVFIQLTFDRALLTSSLWSSLAGPLNILSNPEDRFAQALNKKWHDFLGLDVTKYVLRPHKNYQRSPQYWDGVAATEYWSRFVDDVLFEAKAITSKGGDFLSVQTLRTLYNDELAGLLGIPYIASTIRSPIHSLVLADKCSLPSVIEATIDQVAPTLLEPGTANEPYSEHTAPFVLALVFREMNAPSDFFVAAQTIRQQFAPFRELVSSRKHEWKGRSSSFIHELKTALDDITRHCEAGDKVVQGVAMTAPAMATSTPSRTAWAKLFGRLGVLLTPVSQLREWYTRTFKPDLYVLHSLAQEAQHIRAMNHELQRLWPRRWRYFDTRLLDHFATVRPEHSLRLRSAFGNQGA